MYVGPENIVLVIDAGWPRDCLLTTPDVCSSLGFAYVHPGLAVHAGHPPTHWALYMALCDIARSYTWPWIQVKHIEAFEIDHPHFVTFANKFSPEQGTVYYLNKWRFSPLTNTLNTTHQYARDFVMTFRPNVASISRLFRLVTEKSSRASDREIV